MIGGNDYDVGGKHDGDDSGGNIINRAVKTKMKMPWKSKLMVNMMVIIFVVIDRAVLTMNVN